MDEQRSHELLREHTAWGVRPGRRVVLRSSVAGAGADVEAFGRFVEAHGGVHIPEAPDYWLLPVVATDASRA